MKHARGMTLIEVLVALAIVSIALTAIIKATSLSVRDTGYLKQKTMALWVAQNELNQARLHVIAFSKEGSHTTAVTTVLGEMWYWQGTETKTKNKLIKQFKVNVYDHDPDEGDSPIVTLVGYTS